jgi:hypothetical protein
MSTYLEVPGQKYWRISQEDGQVKIQASTHNVGVARVLGMASTQIVSSQPMIFSCLAFDSFISVNSMERLAQTARPR